MLGIQTSTQVWKSQQFKDMSVKCKRQHADETTLKPIGRCRDWCCCFTNLCYRLQKLRGHEQLASWLERLPSLINNNAYYVSVFLSLRHPSPRASPTQPTPTPTNEAVHTHTKSASYHTAHAQLSCYFLSRNRRRFREVRWFFELRELFMHKFHTNTSKT